MNNDSAHNSNWAIAEIVFGVPFLISIVLQFIFPFSFPPGILHKVLMPVGIALIITSIYLLVLSRREMSLYGQPTDPGHPTSRLVKTGTFSFSRNPLYLSSVIFLFGIALTMIGFWSFVAILVSMIACHYILVVPEEKYLTAKFGKEYQEYTNAVHRWFGRK